MPNKPPSIKDILGEKGSLARSLQGFEVRPSQIQMAMLIEKSLEQEVPAIIEAGTGTGKTLGYLVPVILSGKRTVVSTGTKNLQEQIFFKDIPLISENTGLKVDPLLMKGRKNYICLHRYQQYFFRQSLLEPGREEIRRRIDQWLEKTEFADRGELGWLSDDDPLWDALSASSEQCLGSECAHMEDCYLNRLRKRAAQCELIIVNHHLFFADLMVKKSGFGEIIPRFQVAVFDEAHKIEEIATTYFGLSLSTGQLADLIKEVEKERGSLKVRGGEEVGSDLNAIGDGIAQLQRSFISSEDRARLNKEELSGMYNGALAEIRKGLNHIRQRAGQHLAARAGELGEALEIIFAFDDSNWLKWYEKRKRGIIFHASPLDISQSMRDLLYAKPKTIVFTSATLSTNGSFDYIRSRLGIPGCLEGIYPSHFDFQEQALIYIPRDLPPPNARDFASRIAMRIVELLKISSGRALLLFTSYLNLNTVHTWIKGKIPYRVYRQGDAPRSVLLERFRRDTHSILLATGSFWQGVDVPGDALSCLIVDKLPFDSPGDPLVAARIESIHARGGNPFMEYQLPAAIIALKQGLGRLIRKSSDRGIIAIMDVRMMQSRYGRFFFESLPEIPVSHDLREIEMFFREWHGS